MVLKIDRCAHGKYVVLRLSGRMQSENLDQLRAQMEQSAQIVLDLEDLKLVDIEAVRFLGECAAKGTELRHCSQYIRQWIANEAGTLGSE